MESLLDVIDSLGDSLQEISRQNKPFLTEEKQIEEGSPEVKDHLSVGNYYSQDSIPVIEGSVREDKSTFFLAIDAQLYKIHSFDSNKLFHSSDKPVNGSSQYSGQLFIYADCMREHTGIDGYVYPGTLRKV